MPATALLLIDIQNDYFPRGRFPVPGADAAGAQAGRLLDHFRSRGLPVVHVWHESLRPGASFFLPGSPGADIHACVAPRGGEPLVRKHLPNSFSGTGLEALLRGLGVQSLVLCGMMTHLCVDAGMRGAVDLGFSCTLVHDACAAPGLSFDGVDVPAAQVQAAFAAALAFGYGRVLSCQAFLAGESRVPQTRTNRNK